MSKLIEDLKAAGWVETTLGECRLGEEVLLTQDGRFPRAVRVTKPAEWGGEKGPLVNISDGGARWGTTPVLRAPRPAPLEGTVALIRWREDQPPGRAWKTTGHWVLSGGAVLDDDDAEVVRVLLPAEQDTPPVEVTDEMVSAALNRLINEEVLRGECAWQDGVEATRAALEAALEVNA
ncbi:MAG: hypothetical protein L0I17_04905 [Actinomycetia bacterium]|nr:hypothetical protein [Actinomycetes bacterium]